MFKNIIYLIFLLKIFNNADNSSATIRFNTPPPQTTPKSTITTKLVIVTTQIVITTTLLKKPTESTTTPTVTTTLATTTPNVLKSSGFLLVEDAGIEDIDEGDVKKWIVEANGPKTDVSIVDKSIVPQGGAQIKRRKRAIQKNLAIRFIGESSETDTKLTDLTNVQNTSINNKTVKVAKLWKTGEDACGTINCTESFCQVNNLGDFICETCLTLKSPTNEKWTTNDTSLFKDFYCPEPMKRIPKSPEPQLLALIAIPCIDALILLIVLLYCCCKKKRSKNQNHELNRIHPAMYENDSSAHVNEYANAKENEDNDGNLTKNENAEKIEDFASKSDTFRYSTGPDIINNKGSVRGLY